MYEIGMNEGWQAQTNEGQVGRKTAGGDEPRLVGTNHGTRGRTTAGGDIFLYIVYI